MDLDTPGLLGKGAELDEPESVENGAVPKLFDAMLDRGAVPPGTDLDVEAPDPVPMGAPERDAVPLDEGNGGMTVELELMPVPGSLLDNGAVPMDEGTGKEAAEPEAPRLPERVLEKKAELLGKEPVPIKVLEGGAKPLEEGKGGEAEAEPVPSITFEEDAGPLDPLFDGYGAVPVEPIPPELLDKGAVPIGATGVDVAEPEPPRTLDDGAEPLVPADPGDATEEGTLPGTVLDIGPEPVSDGPADEVLDIAASGPSKTIEPDT